MKLIGIVGSAVDASTNRQLLTYIKKHYQATFTLELVEARDFPIFNQDEDITNTPAMQRLNQQIMMADGVIISTAEHNHTITSALKSLLEWLSFNIHPLENKHIMIVGASWLDQGTSRAQLHLRQILDAPGVNALVMPGNEFLLAAAKEAFDDNGDLKDAKTVAFLDKNIGTFIKFINAVSSASTHDTKTEPNQNVSVTKDNSDRKITIEIKF